LSGGHFNCAVTVGLWAGGRFKTSDVIPYIIAQVLGAIVAAAVLYAIASGKPDWVPAGFASNGYGDLSPGKYGLASCFLIEVIATFFFLSLTSGRLESKPLSLRPSKSLGLCPPKRISDLNSASHRDRVVLAAQSIAMQLGGTPRVQDFTSAAHKAGDCGLHLRVPLSVTYSRLTRRSAG